MSTENITKENIAQNVDDYINKVFPGFKFRKHQKEEIVNIIFSALTNEKMTYICSAPTGSGKSFISLLCAGVLYNYYDMKSYILASDLSLYKQYEDIIDKIDMGFGKLKGMGNYTCEVNSQPIDLGECRLSGYSPKRVISDSHLFRCAPGCPYMIDRDKASKMPVTLMTYALFASIVKRSDEYDNPEFSDRDIIFCDECHNIPEIVQSLCSVTLKFSDLKFLKTIYEYCSLHTDLFYEQFDSVRDIYDRFPDFSEVINEYRDIFKRFADSGSYEKSYKILDELIAFWDFFELLKEFSQKYISVKMKPGYRLDSEDSKLMHAVRRLEKYWYGGQLQYLFNMYTELGEKYIVKSISIDDTKEVSILLQCSKEDIISYDNILKKSPRQVMLSATPGDIDSFVENIGAKIDEENNIIYTQIPSEFDFSRSPIYFLNRFKMSFENKKESLKSILPILWNTFEKNSGKHGMVLTGTYDIAKYIVDNAPIEIKNRLITYTNSKDKESALSLHKMMDDSILIGPTLDEGIDLPGDLCRFIVIMKVPYPNMADNLVKAKMEIFPKWYMSTTANSMIQGIGRGNRFADDWCKTYIYDACFESLYKVTKSQWPDWISDRIKIYR